MESLARELALSVGAVRLAADFYSAFPDEIDARIEEDERAAERIRRHAQRREALLSS